MSLLCLDHLINVFRLMGQCSGIVGCVDPEISSEEWLLKNFGSFSVMAQVRDFSSINLLFSGVRTLYPDSLLTFC